MRTIAQKFIGIDLHKTVVQICVLDDSGKVHLERRFPLGTAENNRKVIKYLARWRAKGRFAVEAIGLNRWFVNACFDEGLDLIVVDPAKLNLKMLGKKTDRNDALEIARRLFLGDIDRNALTYYPTDDEYGVRKLLRVRHKLVSIRQQLCNQIRSLLNAYQLRIPGNLYLLCNLARLEQLELASAEMTQVLRTLTGVLAGTHAEIQALSKRIDALARQDERIMAWAALPSVGPQTAVTLAYELGDLERFTSSRAVASYAGLVPRVADSGEQVRHGGLTKRGNRELRWILGQWAVRLLARNPIAQSWASSRPQRRHLHKNKLRTALARRLLVGLYVSERRGEAFSLETCLAA